MIDIVLGSKQVDLSLGYTQKSPEHGPIVSDRVPGY